jgi:hypothetical protein
MTEQGSVCASCFPLWEAQHVAEQNAENATEVARHRLATRLAALHFCNWGLAVVLFDGWVHVGLWISSILIAGVIVLTVCVRLRSPAAFRAALVADTGGALVLLAASLKELPGRALVFLLFPVFFAWWLAWLMWRSRDAFVEKPRL